MEVEAQSQPNQKHFVGEKSLDIFGGLRATGKKSPISDFEGIFMGRRSSHTPLLEEEANLLNVLLEQQQGMQKAKQNKYCIPNTMGYQKHFVFH